MNAQNWIIDFFTEQIGAGKRFSSRVEMAEYLGLPKTQATKLFNFLKGADTQYKAVLDWFAKLGGRLVEPQREKIREVCFVDAKIAPSGQNAPPPESEDYVAVPLVGEVGAGPGMVDQHELLSWVLVYRGHGAVARRSNLLAVEVGRNQRSMIPLLHPGDIVLVDLDDWGQEGFHAPGNIYLVREPGQEGGGKIKRVALAGKGDSAIMTYYSENAQENEPEPYFLHQDFDGDLRKAIVGKIIWAWTDLSRK